MENTEIMDSQQAQTPKAKDNEKILAVVCHSVGMVVIPLLVYLLKKDESPYLARHAKQSLVWQAGVSIVCTVLSFVIGAIATLTLGFGALLYLLIPPAALVAFCIGLYAAYQCWEGKEYEYPMIQSLVNSL